MLAAYLTHTAAGLARLVDDLAGAAASGTDMDCTAPTGVRCVVLTVPLPLQSGHISGVVPGAQPVPLQSGHCSMRGTVTSFLQPKAASSKLTVTEVSMLSPRLGRSDAARAPAAEAEAAEHVAEYIAQIAEAAETAEACAARTAETGVRVKGRMTELIVLLALLWVGRTSYASLPSLKRSSQALSPG